MNWIACKKRRNEPRIAVAVCQKCDLKDDCEEYKDYLESQKKPIVAIVDRTNPLAQEIELAVRMDGFE